MKFILLIALAFLSFSGSLWADETELKTALKPREDKLGAMLVAGVEIRDAKSSEEYSKVWGQFFQVQDKIQSRIGTDLYGITYYPEDYDPRKEGGHIYMVATQVKDFEELPEGVTGRKIPARNYIVFEHIGSMEKVGETYGYIYQSFIPNSDYAVIYTDTMERYDHRFMKNPENPVFEIWIPVQGKE